MPSGSRNLTSAFCGVFGARVIFAAMVLDLGDGGVGIIDPKPEMMDADKILAALVAGIFLGLKLQQRQIHHPVGEPGRDPRFRNPFEAECFLVEFGGGVLCPVPRSQYV